MVNSNVSLATNTKGVPSSQGGTSSKRSTKKGKKGENLHKSKGQASSIKGSTRANKHAASEGEVVENEIDQNDSFGESIRTLSEEEEPAPRYVNMYKRSVKNPHLVDLLDTERIKDNLMDKDLYEESGETTSMAKE